MTAILRAPELSATSRMERIWIIRSSCPAAGLDRARLLQHARHDPPLAAAERTRRHEGDLVADLRLVLLVMRHEARGQAPLLPVQLVAHLALDRHHYALGHLVA